MTAGGTAAVILTVNPLVKAASTDAKLFRVTPSSPPAAVSTTIDDAPPPSAVVPSHVMDGEETRGDVRGSSMVLDKDADRCSADGTRIVVCGGGSVLNERDVELGGTGGVFPGGGGGGADPIPRPRTNSDDVCCREVVTTLIGLLAASSTVVSCVCLAMLCGGRMGWTVTTSAIYGCATVLVFNTVSFDESTHPAVMRPGSLSSFAIWTTVCLVWGVTSLAVGMAADGHSHALALLPANAARTVIEIGIATCAFRAHRDARPYLWRALVV